MSVLRGVPAFLWKYAVGAALSQYALTAVLLIGWTYRLAQRRAVKTWWCLSPESAGTPFRDFARGSERFKPLETWPNWVVDQRALRSIPARMAAGPTPGRKVYAGLAGITASLRANLKIGVLGLLNTFVLTIVPCLLWAFGWYSGWLVSFFKGYEQSFQGALTAVLGIVLFIGVMFYLPMAQTRQAVTGNWRSFYQFRLVWSLIRRRPLACMVLAAMYSLVSLPISIMKVAPLGFADNPNLAVLTDAEFLAYLNRYYFWMGVVGFAAFAGVRLIAARIYAGALVEAVREGNVLAHELGAFEMDALTCLGLVTLSETGPGLRVIALARHVARPAWRVAVGSATAAIWFTFVAQIYISEFFVYHPVRGWLNQPLVQLPWFRYVPDHLEQPGETNTAAELPGHSIQFP